MEKKQNETRFRAIAGLLLGIMAILTMRLWYLQIIRGEESLTKSNTLRTYVIPVAAPRGVMYDRNGKPLVASRIAYSVTVVPEDALRSPDTLKRLSSILSMDRVNLEKTLTEKMQVRGRKPNEPVRLLRDVSPEIAMRIEEGRHDLAGVEIAREPVRDYIFGEMASHLFGYIHEINQQELIEHKEERYRQGDNIGKTGLERTYEQFLRGTSGGREIEVDKVGRLLQILREVNPTPGKDLHLTLDLKLQQAAEKALSEQLQFMQKYSKYRKARSGAVVIMDPRNGDILAMASQPSFDPNIFVGTMPADVSRRLFTNPLHPFTNRALYGQYAPGSTFKPITVAAALETGKTTPKDTFYCGGVDPVSGKKCWIYGNTGHGHGTQTITDGLKNSCNIVMFELARRVGVDNLARYARMFNLGKPTGIDLHPGEKSGLVPDREYKQKRFKGDLAVWRPNETLDFSIGQGFLLLTPLQLAQVFRAIANGGTIYQPRLVTRIGTPDNETFRTVRSRVSGRLGLKESTLEVLHHGMREVVSHGTAAGVFAGFPLDKYPVAAKTGTAQMTGYDNNGLFAAYAPANNPSIVVVVVIEQGGSGSGAAGPVVRRIMESYFDIKPTPRTAATGPATPAAPAAPAADSPEGGNPETQVPVETPVTEPDPGGEPAPPED